MNAVKLKFKTIILYSSSMNLFCLQRITYITYYFFVCNVDLWCVWLYHDVGSQMAPLKVQPQSYSKAQHTIGVPSRSNHFFLVLLFSYPHPSQKLWSFVSPQIWHAFLDIWAICPQVSGSLTVQCLLAGDTASSASEVDSWGSTLLTGGGWTLSLGQEDL